MFDLNLQNRIFFEIWEIWSFHLLLPVTAVFKVYLYFQITVHPLPQRPLTTTTATITPPLLPRRVRRHATN